MADEKYFLSLDGLEYYHGKLEDKINNDLSSRAMTINGIYYGECSTAASTAAKTVTLTNGTGFELKKGVIIVIKFTNNNSASTTPTLNINNTGAKPIRRYATTAASTSQTTSGWRAGAVQLFAYDGSGWVRTFWENTTYSNQSLGQGYGTCSNITDGVASASVSSYALTVGGVVSIRFGVTVPANTNLSVNGKDAKPIFYLNTAIADNIITVDSTATFIYDGSYYHLISIDRWGKNLAEHTHYYAGSTTLGGAAISANKLTVNGGSTTQPIYFKDGVPTTCSYTLGKSVPSNAVFTDTVYTLPTASASTLGGVKIGSNIGISSGAISVPDASGTVKGVTVVYPASSCTTFSSDAGTITPLAAQKATKQFAIPRPNYNASTQTASAVVNSIPRFISDGSVKDSKILIEDVTNTKDSSKKAQVISIPAEGGKKMVYGYCTDQVDGTSFIGGIFDSGATEFPYNAGLAIGGTSGNLLWKGEKVATATDILGCVPVTRTINNKALNANITLSASDVGATPSSHTSATNPHGISKSTIGLANVENKSSVTIRGEITSLNVTTALGYTPVNPNIIGVNGGLAQLDENGYVPSSQLPSYVDDVLEYNAKSSFPTTGTTGKIYVDLSDGKTYRWGGTSYAEISASLALGETSSTAYRGDRGKAAYDHISATNNPHSVTCSQIGALTTSGTAAKATADANGNNIASTYIKSLSASGTVITYTKGNGDQSTITTQDTKNTAGSTNSSSKLFLIGATSQAANPQTYSHDSAYVGTDGCLYSNSTKVSVDGHTHNYAGSSSAGGSATSAVKLDTATAGGTNTPVYFSGGKPVACTGLNLNTTGNAATANQVNNNMVIKFNGGSTEGTNLFTFNGSASKTVNITPSSIGVYTKAEIDAYVFITVDEIDTICGVS